MPLRVPDEEEQSHSVTQKQAPRRYPTQGPKHKHLHDAQLPWVISSHPYGLAGCHRPLRLLNPSHKPGLEYFQAIQDPLPSPIQAQSWMPGSSCSNATSSTLHSALQLRGSLPPCSHQGAVPTLHPHVPPLTILPSPPALVQTFPLPLSSSSM